MSTTNTLAYQQANLLRQLIETRTSIPSRQLVCPREKSDMTPCIARDGATAVCFSETTGYPMCVGCAAGVVMLLHREQEKHSAAARRRPLPPD